MIEIGTTSFLKRSEVEELKKLKDEFEELEEKLSKNKELWNLLLSSYSGHPLSSLDEFIGDLEELPDGETYKFEA